MTAFLNSFIARDDDFIFAEGAQRSNTVSLDILGNDGGGKAKRLVSINADQPLDLLMPAPSRAA